MPTKTVVEFREALLHSGYNFELLKLAEEAVNRIESIESEQTEHLKKVEEWHARIDELGRMVTDAEQQTQATVHALQEELKLVVGENMQAARAILRLENELEQSLRTNRVLQTQMQALTEKTNA